MKLGIQSHVAGLSLSNTVSLLAELGVERSRKAVHDWVQKADLQPTHGRSPATQMVLAELREKHFVESAVFLVDGAQHLKTVLSRTGLRFHPERHGNRNSVERIFRGLKRRTSSFANCFSRVFPETAENGLQAFVRWLNETN